MADLFLCHTAYQVLIALVRALRAGGADFVLTAGIPDAAALGGRLQAAGAANAVTVVDESLWPGTVSGPFAHARNRRAFEKNCGWRLNPADYAHIYISNDWSVLGRYLQDCNAPYTLCEDTVGGTLDPDQHLLDAQRAAPKGLYQYWGDAPQCQTVESEDAEQCTLFPREKLATFSKRALLANLTEAEKTAVRRVFITRPLPERAEGATLLLPRSFVLDGLMTQAEQDAMFQAVAAKYCEAPLFIKTHPRDETDYAALFPGAVILERTMPGEVLNFCLPFRFKRAVTVQSWVLRGFTAAEETVFVSLEDAKRMIAL